MAVSSAGVVALVATSTSLVEARETPAIHPGARIAAASGVAACLPQAATRDGNPAPDVVAALRPKLQ